MFGKLLINIVIDNSACLKGEAGEKLVSSVSSFDKKIKDNNLNDSILYSLTVNKGFSSCIIKNFNEDYDYNGFKILGLPFVNSSLLLGTNNLMKFAADIAKTDKIFKPWTIFLTTGDSYDKVDESINLLLTILKDGKMSYFPFALTYNELDSNILKLRKLKPFTTIKDNMYSNLFDWIFDFASNRVNTPLDKSISLNPNSFEGWTIK